MKGIVLVGFMGTGKTTVGRELAARLRWPYVDTDLVVTQWMKKSITRIIKEDGKDHFRQLETRVLEILLSEGSQAKIIATGGGIVLAERNWPLLRALGHVICLKAKPAVILQRVGTAQDRPLLAGTPKEVKQRIADLLRQRRTMYAQADWTITTDLHSPAEMAEAILAWKKSRETKKKG